MSSLLEASKAALSELRQIHDELYDLDVTDATFDDLSWNNRGNGPEPTHGGVTGPFASELEALKWVDNGAIR
jgi:hypothetical protein